MNSDEKPFRVVDRRRFSNYSTTHPAEEKYTLPKNPVLDDPYEVFRVACASGHDKPPEATTEKYEPVPVIEPHVSVAPHKDSNADSRFLNRVFGSVLLVGGLGLGIALYIGNQNNTPRNYTPTSSSAAQTQQIYRSATEQPQQKTFRARAVPTGFREYREALASEYAEFKNGEHVTLNEIPIPPELVGRLNDPYNVPHAFSIDMNDDGINEVVLQEGCGSGGCWGQIYQKTDAGFVPIIDESVRVLSREKTNGYRNAFLIKKVYLPAGGSTDVATKYIWNGQSYQKTNIILDPDMLSETASNFRDFFKSGRDASDVQRILQELEDNLGTDNILGTILLSQLSPNIPLPEGDEYDRFLLQLSQERGINYTGYSPDQLRRALFSTMISPDMLRSREGLVTVAGLSIANSLAKELGMDPYSQYINTLAKTNGYVANYISQTGNKPNPERLSQILAYGSADAIREEELHTHQGYSEEIGHTRTNPDGSSNYTGQIYPGATAEQMREIQAQQQHDAIQQRGRENQQRFENDVRRRGGQVIDGAKKAIEKILPPPKKPPGK